MSETLLDRLERMPRIVRLLDQLCDFRPFREAPPGWFAFEPDGPMEIFGRDAAGGRFVQAVHPDDGGSVILFVSSEGEAGAIARSFDEAFQTMAALPYWRDCLKFSAGGSLDTMRRAAAHFEEELRVREPKIDRLRQDIHAGLKLPKLENALERLHGRVTAGAGRQVVATTDRNPFASLFNTFAV